MMIGQIEFHGFGIVIREFLSVNFIILYLIIFI
jgi:hypothetical protein